jgi:glycosyltransferase involved in cell wall biosynthesis
MVQEKSGTSINVKNERQDNLISLVSASLIILTKNEITGLNAVFDTIPIKKIDDVFAIDGQSNDGSKEFLEKKGIKVYSQKRLGRAEAFRMAIDVAKHNNIVFFSPDGNEDAKDIIPLLTLLGEDCDMSIGSRFMEGGRSDDDDIPLPIRGFGNKGFTLIANILWNGQLTDSINGFRAIKKEVFMDLNPDSEGFGIEYQLSIRALKKKYKIKEIPTYEGDRIGGQSTARTIPTGLYFIKLLLREMWIGKHFDK